MRISNENTSTLVRNLRAEGESSRADYIEMMQDAIDELRQKLEFEREDRIDLVSRERKRWASHAAGVKS